MENYYKSWEIGLLQNNDGSMTSNVFGTKCKHNHRQHHQSNLKKLCKLMNGVGVDYDTTRKGRSTWHVDLTQSV